MSLGGAVSAAASRDGLLESATQINATFARLRGEEAGPAGACASVSAAPYLLTVVMVISREPARGAIMIHLPVSFLSQELAETSVERARRRRSIKQNRRRRLTCVSYHAR